MVPANIVKISTATTGNTITKIKPVLSMFELGGLELDFISCTEIRKKYLNFNFNCEKKNDLTTCYLCICINLAIIFS